MLWSSRMPEHWPGEAAGGGLVPGSSRAGMLIKTLNHQTCRSLRSCEQSAMSCTVCVRGPCPGLGRGLPSPPGGGADRAL